MEVGGDSNSTFYNARDYKDLSWFHVVLYVNAC